MILLYHKVDLEAKTHWWVTADAFDRQMADLQAFEVVHLDDYDPTSSSQAVITFDGVYENVYRYALPILEKWGYPFELFVVSDVIGSDNEFDQHVEPAARFTSLDELKALAAAGGRVQWHTRTHRDLSGMSEEERDWELTVPAELKAEFGSDSFRWFAYPHGQHADLLMPSVERRFSGAVAVTLGDQSRYQLQRTEIVEDQRFSQSTVSVVIPNYNYGHFLPEAIESVICQTHPPDEILVIDDCSTDDSNEVLAWYSDRVRIEVNSQNLGIVRNFSKAVNHTAGDYIAFLGADNRMRSDYVERMKAVLDSDPEAVLAYSDMSIFGQLARLLAERVGAEPTATANVYTWRFPEPTPERLAGLDRKNFIHGSAMYRRADYERVGGYRESAKAEDHDLFRRMLSDGRHPVHITEALVEYRQHSADQANTTLGARMAEARQRRHVTQLKQRVAADDRQIKALQAEVNQARKRVKALEAKIRLMEGTVAWRLRARLVRLVARLPGSLDRRGSRPQ